MAAHKKAAGSKTGQNPGALTWTSLGGNNPDNIGGNAHAYTYSYTDSAGKAQSETIMVDLGVMFADKAKTGFDSIFPDVSDYFQKHGKAPVQRARALLLTHGHLDHIGAIGHMISGHPEMRFHLPPIYGTPMTIEMLKGVLASQGVKPQYWPELHVVGSPAQIKAYDASLAKGRIEQKDWPQRHALASGEALSIGKFKVEWVPVSHSMCNAAALHIQTPGARVLHSGDVKVDQSVMIGPGTDLDRLAEIGGLGVDALMIDSTRADAPGFTPPESDIRKSLLAEVRKYPDKRVVVVLMGSNMERIAGIAEIAAASGRMLTTHGPAIEKSILAAKKAGIQLEDVIDQDLRDDFRKMSGKSKTAQELAPEQELALATGTQGETNAAAWKASEGAHKTLSLGPDDVVIISASPIPGNEAQCEALYKKIKHTGAQLVTFREAQVHASGHGHREDLKAILNAVKPVTVFPVHGDYSQTASHADFIRQQGYAARQVRNGARVELARGQTPQETGQAPSNWVGIVDNSDPKQPWIKNYAYKRFAEPRPAAPKAPSSAPPAGPNSALPLSPRRKVTGPVSR